MATSQDIDFSIDVNYIVDSIEKYSRCEINLEELERLYEKCCFYAEHLLDPRYDDDDEILNFLLYFSTLEYILKHSMSPDGAKIELHLNKKLIHNDKMIDSAPKAQSKKFCVESIYTGDDKIVYLDQNVLSPKIQDDSYLLIPNGYKIAYSGANIEEIYKCDELHKKELIDGIRRITEKMVILFIDKKLTICYEDPKYSYDRVSSDPEAGRLAEEDKVLVNEGYNLRYKKYVKTSHRGKINNYKGNEFFINYQDEIKEILPQITLGALEDISLEKDVLYDKLNPIIHDLYALMDIMGYKKDNQEKRIRSSRHDIEHILYATGVDYFITNDDKLIFRAKNILNFLGRKTKVMTADEFNKISK